jgi:hypothetical protein
LATGFGKKFSKNANSKAGHLDRCPAFVIFDKKL